VGRVDYGFCTNFIVYARDFGQIIYSGGRVFDSEGITIEAGREKKEEKRGRGGEKEHLPFISIASFASSL
jgi:hypothetical protein